MTNEVLQKISKKYRICLDYYDEVISYINDNYTYVIITFAKRENLGGNSHYYNQLNLRLSVTAIMKRNEFEEDYCTNGWQWISDIDINRNK